MGYFPFDRNVREHWVYKDSQYYHVWSEMLFTARYAEEPKTFLHEGELITVEYGEFIFGRISWSEKLGISEQRLRTLISKMKKEEMIVPTKQYRKSTVYLVKNYRLYNQQSNQQQTLVQQAFEANANQQTNVTSTSNQPATNQQPTTKEESNKEIREEGKEEDIKPLVDKPPTYDDEFENFWLEYPSERRRDKSKSYDKWKIAIKTISKVELTECVKRYAKDKKAIGHDGGYAKMPVTFLNGKTYMDYVKGDKDDETSEHTERIGGKYAEYVIE